MNQDAASPVAQSSANQARLSTLLQNDASVVAVFGPQDTTPWSILWLAFAWSVLEAVPGASFFLRELNNQQPTGDSIIGAFFLATSLAGGAIWIWWTMMGSMPHSRRWQVFVASCLALIIFRFVLPAPLLSVVAVFAWAMTGTTAVVLSVRYLLGLSLEPRPIVKIKSELTIWLLLRYTLAAAVLAWFTRSIANQEDALLSRLEIFAIGLPLGLIVGLSTFAMLWMFTRRFRWVYLGLLFVVVLPLAAAVTMYLIQVYNTQEILIVSGFMGALSLFLHTIFLGLPLIARGLRFHSVESSC